MAKKQTNKQAAKTAPGKAPLPAPLPAAQSKEGKQMPPDTGGRFSVHLKLAFFLCIVSLAVYANTLKNGFVLDDHAAIDENTFVTKGLPAIPEILATPYRRGFWKAANDLYRPLSLVSFAAEYQFFGKNPVPYHLINILLYAGCVILLFLFLVRLFGRNKTAVAFIASLLFALHPIHTEVVANIKSRDELLCFFFAFLSLNVFIKYMRGGKTAQLLTASFCFFLSLLSKETTITFLAIIPLVFFFYSNENKKRGIYITVCSVIVAIIYLSIRFSVLNYYHANDANIPFIDNALVSNDISYASRMATALLILGYYLKLLFVPYPLVCDYSYNSIPFVNFGNLWVLLSLAAYLLLLVYGIKRLFKNGRDPFAFGILFFLITISLFSNTLFLIGTIMGERLLFFPSVGFCLFAAAAIEKWVVRTGLTYALFLKNTYTMAVLIPLCVIFAALTINRNNAWKDDTTLFKTDVAASPDNARLNCYYGNKLVNAGESESDTAKQKLIINKSIFYLRKALNLYPGYSTAHEGIGDAYSLLHNSDSFEVHEKLAIQLDPSNYRAINNLAVGDLALKQYAQAIPLFKEAIAINPDFIKGNYNLGCIYIETKQYDSAIYYLNQTLALHPGDTGVNSQLGIAYFRLQKYEMAEQYYKKAFTDGDMQLGIAYFEAQNYLPAEIYFKKAIALKPNDVNARNNLGVLYSKTGKLPQALELYQQTVAIDPAYANGYSNVGHCYFEMKQYNETITNIHKAIALDPQKVADIPFLALSYKGLGKTDSAKKYEAMAQKYIPGFRL